MARPPRLQTFDYTGEWRYFVTTCTFQRARLFTDAAVVTRAIEQFQQSAAVHDIALLAYCFMPDHAHLLAGGVTRTADFAKFMKLAKQRTGWQYRRDVGRRLWQEGYADRVVRNDESTVDIVRYIVNNPVRAGLAQAPAEYPHWGSCVYTREEILDLLIDEADPRSRPTY